MIIRGRKKWLVFVNSLEICWCECLCLKMFSYFTHSLQVYYERISQLEAKLFKIVLDSTIEFTRNGVIFAASSFGIRLLRPTIKTR